MGQRPFVLRTKKNLKFCSFGRWIYNSFQRNYGGISFSCAAVQFWGVPFNETTPDVTPRSFDIRHLCVHRTSPCFKQIKAPSQPDLGVSRWQGPGEDAITLYNCNVELYYTTTSPRVKSYRSGEKSYHSALPAVFWWLFSYSAVVHVLFLLLCAALLLLLHFHLVLLLIGYVVESRRAMGLGCSWCDFFWLMWLFPFGAVALGDVTLPPHDVR